MLRVFSYIKVSQTLFRIPILFLTSISSTIWTVPRLFTWRHLIQYREAMTHVRQIR